MNYHGHGNDCYGFCRGCAASVMNNEKAYRNPIIFDMCGVANKGFNFKLKFIGGYRNKKPERK
jgi:hypothetical protein